jgi:hypothetical protein
MASLAVGGGGNGSVVGGGKASEKASPGSETTLYV